MKKKYPFKFLDAYTAEDKDVFFGRQAEVDSLYDMVFQADIILVYGASGTGKTSLIQCGLAGKFQSHDWLPLWVRRGKGLNEALDRVLSEAAGEIEEEEALAWLDEDFVSDIPNQPAPEPQPTLSRRFSAIYRRHFRPIYLIFDQFEELYTLGNADEQSTFIATVKDILQLNQPVKLIISMREEFLGHLYDFEKAVPELLRKKLRVEPMNLDKVRQVLLSIDRLPQSLVHLKEGEKEQVAEEVFKHLRGKEKLLKIPLPYLQVFLDKLYLKITKDVERRQEAIFSLEALDQMEEIGDVLQDFLGEQVLKIREELESEGEFLFPETVFWSILSPFATLEGTKAPRSLEGLTEDLAATVQTALEGKVEDVRPFIGKVVGLLEEKRILRFSEGEGLYELAHDSLAQRIVSKRSVEDVGLLEIRRLIGSQMALREEARELLSEKQLNLIEPYLQKLALKPEERLLIEQSRAAVKAARRAEARRRRLLFLGMTVALVVVSTLAIWAVINRNMAINTRNAMTAKAFEAQMNSAEALKLDGRLSEALEKLQEAEETAVRLDEAALSEVDERRGLWRRVQALETEAQALVSDSLRRKLELYQEADLVSPDTRLKGIIQKQESEIEQRYIDALNRAESNLRAGNLDRVKQAYEEALSLKPDSISIRKKLEILMDN